MDQIGMEHSKSIHFFTVNFVQDKICSSQKYVVFVLIFRAAKNIYEAPKSCKKNLIYETGPMW